MRIRGFRHALSSCVAAALLAGCGGSQPPIGAPGAMPLSRAIMSTRTAVRQHGSASSSYHVLYSFGSSLSDGISPAASLIEVKGALYGTTSAGGEGGPSCSGTCGTVFSITPAGSEHVLYSFQGGHDGSEPTASLLDVNGALYGTTKSGGGYSDYCPGGCGTVFSITTTGKERVLHIFGRGGSDGEYPEASLIDVGGTLYGTTEQGGKYGGGTVFSISTTGKEHVLYSFNGKPNGLEPDTSLVDVNGTLYGTTSLGGNDNVHGTIFRITTTGTEHVLYSFRDSHDGSDPEAGLLDVNGTLYGTTAEGGKGHGTLFSVTTSGAEHVLHNFTGRPDGDDPRADLIEVKGNLYGTTQDGGAYGSGYSGTVFSSSTAGTVTVLHSFGGGSDGVRPTAGLLDVNRTLYGVTPYGGTYGYGTVFTLTR
jgi:uncharacterized repeat protein (TIGR03803 family)